MARLAEEISYSEAGITARETKDLWDMPVIFLLALMLRASEWVLRRKCGSSVMRGLGKRGLGIWGLGVGGLVHRGAGGGSRGSGREPGAGGRGPGAGDRGQEPGAGGREPGDRGQERGPGARSLRSPRRRVAVSPRLFVAASPRLFVTASPRLRVSASLVRSARCGLAGAGGDVLCDRYGVGWGAGL